MFFQAWRLWNENNILSLIDATISDPHFKDQILKCIHLGLLCVQEHPEDRPTISALISMLDVDEAIDLPHPKQPAFTQNIASCPDGVLRNCSINQVSMTLLSGR